MISILSILLLIPFACTSTETTRRPHPSPKHDLISFHYMNPISKTDFRNQGEASLLKTCTVTTPGTAVFVDDIGYQGTSSSTAAGGNAAFFASSDNLVIDLGGKTLFQTSATANTNGIEINTNQKNITIKNGSIVGFKGAGIYVRSGCDNIRIQNVVISSCGKQGIYFAGTAAAGTSVTNCIIDGTIVSRTSGIATVANAVGLQLDYCQNIFVNNSIFSNSDAQAASMDGVGVFVQNSSNIVFDHCDASSNKGQDAYGFKITGTTIPSSTCTFLDCTAQNNTGVNATGGTGYGFFGSIITACLWERCMAFANTGTKNSYGFYAANTQYCNYVACESNCNTAGTFAVAATDGAKGFYSTNGAGNTYTKCIATGNLGNSAKILTMGIGFDLQTELFDVIADCEARTNGNDTSLAWGVGINCAGCSQVVIKNSRLLNNRSNTLNQGYGIRDTAANSTTLITDCFLYGNGQGTNYTNFTVTYPGLGELNTTAPVTVGGMGGISIVKPFQNVIVTPS